nr:carbohydrate sulfotransferase 3-like [Procambarus clarkii]
MVIGVRKQHWFLLSLSLTGVLLLLVYSTKPLTTRTPLPEEAEVGFLRRRIANDESSGGPSGPGLEPQVDTLIHHTAPPHPTPPPPHPTPPPHTPVHLSKKEREDLAKQGVLLLEDDHDGPAEHLQADKQDKTNERQQQHHQTQSYQNKNKHLESQQQNNYPVPRVKQEQTNEKHLQKQEGSQHDQWLHQIELQHKDFLKQQHRLQEHHLKQAQILQEKLQQEQETGRPEDTTDTHHTGLDPQSHNTSGTGLAKMSQANLNVPLTKIDPNKNTVPPMPHISYANLKKQGENVLRHFIRREFMNVKRDTNFIPGELVEPSQVRRVIIVSTWRSGSSYLGDLVKAYPGTFFSFEPLHHLLKNLHLQEGPLVEEVVRLLRSILTCDFSQLDVYINYMRNNTFLIDRNTRLWKSCAFNRALCFDKDYLSRACRYMPLNMLKTVRMGLLPVVELLQDPSLDLRVVHLVRDPRGCLHSRMQLSWCQSQACSDPETVCNDLLTDLKLSDRVKQNFPDRYLMVRYEDMGLKPEQKAQEIIKFLGLSYNKYIHVFVREHTTPSRRTKKKGDAYSTFRDSKATTFAWRGALNYTVVEAIQEVCKEPLQKLQLRIFQTEEEYQNTTISVLLNS